MSGVVWAAAVTCRFSSLAAAAACVAGVGAAQRLTTRLTVFVVARTLGGWHGAKAECNAEVGEVKKWQTAGHRRIRVCDAKIRSKFLSRSCSKTCPRVCLRCCALFPVLGRCRIQVRSSAAGSPACCFFDDLLLLFARALALGLCRARRTVGSASTSVWHASRRVAGGRFCGWSSRSSRPGLATACFPRRCCICGAPRLGYSHGGRRQGFSRRKTRRAVRLRLGFWTGRRHRSRSRSRSMHWASLSRVDCKFEGLSRTGGGRAGCCRRLPWPTTHRKNSSSTHNKLGNASEEKMGHKS